MASRIDSFKEFVEKDPESAFARYSLAMAYRNDDKLEAAKEQFKILLGKQPDYIPAYYQAAKTHELLDDLDQARATYAKGIEVAEAQNDSHAAGEAREALDLLG